MNSIFRFLSENLSATRTTIILAFLLCSSCVKQQEPDALVLIQVQDRNGLSETISTPDRLVPFTRMDFLSSQPYKQVLRVYRSVGQTRSILTTYHPNGTLWQLLEAKEMRAFGSFRQWFPGGTQQIEATVIGGTADLSLSAQKTWLFDGLCKVWDEGGQLIAQISYDKGVLSGTSTYFYSSGALKEEVPYVQDRIDGELREFWEGGQMRSSTFYVQGNKEGESIGFWPNGTRCWRERYAKGALIDGMYQNTDQQEVGAVKNGEGVRAVFQETMLSELQEIRKGVVEGVVKYFNARGELSSLVHLRDGKKQGEEVIYYSKKETGSEELLPKLSLNWDADTIHGMVKSWYSNGQLQSQRELVRNKRSGTSLAWYRDGTLMLIEEYENDQLEKGKYFRKKGREPVSTITNGTGTATLYDEDGVLLHKVQYLKGKIIDPD